MLSQLKIKNLEMEIAAIKSRDSHQMKLKVYGILNSKICKCVSNDEFCEGVISADMIERVETDFQNNREYYYILLEFERYYMFIGLLKDNVDCRTIRIINLIDKKSKLTLEDINRMIESSPCRYSEFKFDYPVFESSYNYDCDIVFESKSKYDKLPSNVSNIERLIIKSLLKYEPEETDVSETESEYEEEDGETEGEESETGDED